MSQPSPSRLPHRSLLLSVVIFVLTLAVIELRRRAMTRNQAAFHERYDSAGLR